MMTIPGYTLIAPICEDGDVILYRASRMRDGLPVLLKVPAAYSLPPLIFRRLEHEYELGRDFDPKRIVRPIALERHAGTAALILEHGPSRSLASVLGSPMDIHVFLRIAIGIAEALTELHRNELIHKDIKPEHVLLDEDGHVWLTGLGIASLLPREHQPPTPPEAIDGTLAYMAPEQTGRMNRSIDSRSDLYTLGVIFYQMLTGELPFTAKDPMGWVHCHIARQAEPMIRRVPNIPQPLSAMVMKLLAKNAEERYQGAAGLGSDLRYCLQQWQSKGDIQPFPLGEKDMVDRLLIPEKLYGRQAEIDTLLAAFARVVAGGRSELVLVSGYAGVGKTAVVHELQKALVAPRGLFAAGKFDQYKRDIPYATLVQALQTLVRQILGQNEAEVAIWRETMRKALGPNGRLIVRLIPEVEHIIGKQPLVPDLPPQEARNRFQMVLLRFIGVFAGAEHPLVLFLDDLQWLDAATLELLTHLLTTEQETYGLLLIGAYRDNEVTPTHPLMQTLETIRKKGGKVQDIVLAPLTLDDVGSLVADTLHSSRERVLPLAQLLHEKTGGNPFFTIQFLTSLNDEDLLVYDPGAGHWTWDLTLIKAKGFTDNVVDLMLAKLGRLPETTREALTQFACLGNVAPISTLAMVFGQSKDALYEALWPAVHAGLIVRVADAYHFLHDRVQEAAYALIPQADRKPLHLNIGRLLLDQYSREVLADQVFDVADQFNRGIDIVTDASEKETLRRLNTAAGRRARGAVAYASARHYLKQAMALLPAKAWHQCHAQCLALFLELAECEYLVGNFECADQLLREALEQTGSTLDVARVHSLRMRLYQISGRFHEALAVAFEALGRFGLTFPEKENVQEETEAELRRLHKNMRGCHISELYDPTLTNNPETQALTSLLAAASSLIFIMRREIWFFYTARTINICLQRGHWVESSLFYSNHAVTLASDIDNIQMAEEFSELAIEMSTRTPGAAIVRGKTLFLHAINVICWRKHIAESLPLLEQAFRACLDVGDLVYGSYTTYHAIWHHLENGDSLAHVREVARRVVNFARQSSIGTVYQVDRMSEHFILALEGKTRSLIDFSDSSFDEAACGAAIEQAGFNLGISFYRVMKLMATFLNERFDEARDWAGRLTPTELMPCVNGATYHFYHALTLAALHNQVAAEQQRRFEQTLAEILPKLKSWADHCPENFANRYFLVSAEVARIEGRDLDAMRLYDQAIRSARDNHFVNQEALAAEIASRFYRLRGFDRIADGYLRDAHGAYARWGAVGKVRQLEQAYPQLRETPPLASGTTLPAKAQNPDIQAIIQASQAISGEIHLDSLLKALMRIILENAGARQGYLLLHQKEELTPAAAARVEQQTMAIHVHGEPEFPESALPTSILNYVRRSGDWVLLDDAASLNPYSSDEYFTGRHPKSVLCFPVTKQTELIGVFYLENDIATHAFTSDRLALLELLAAQAAISLENALMYRALQESEKGLRQLTRFHQTILDSAAYSIVTSTQDGIVTSFNPAAERLLGYTADEVIGKQTPALWHDPKEIAQHARRLSAELGERIAPGFDVFKARPQRNLPEENEWTFVRKDGTRLPVNLSVTALRDEDQQITGYVGLIYDLTERKKAEAEIRRLNAELEQRVAERTVELSVAKEQAEKANRAKSMFLANMSHELRTPLNAILGYSQLMRRDASLAPTHRKYLAIVNRSGEDLLALINEVLEISKIEAGQTTLHNTTFDLRALLGNLETMFATSMDAKGLQFDVNGVDTVPRYVASDENKLRQVLVNLLGNALKFTDQGGVTMRVAVQEERPTSGEMVRLSFAVKDTGVGIADEEQEKVFAYFEQTASGKNHKSGSGLGLAISRDFARMMGGDITVTSTKGQGSTFTLHISIRTSSASDIQDTTSTPRVIGLSPDQKIPRILVAEDVASSRILLVGILTTAGFDVREAANGKEAVEIFTHWRPHFIWMDVRMPVMDGLEATRRIKATETGSATIVAALTAHALEEEKETILSAGCDDFVPKPFREQEIFAIMAKHLQLKYVYQDHHEDVGPVVPEVKIRPEQLAALPADLLRRLRSAAVELDLDRILALIEKIKTIDAHLAKGLRTDVENFTLGPLLDLLDKIDRPEDGDFHGGPGA